MYYFYSRYYYVGLKNLKSDLENYIHKLNTYIWILSSLSQVGKKRVEASCLAKYEH